MTQGLGGPGIAKPMIGVFLEEDLGHLRRPGLTQREVMVGGACVEAVAQM